MLVKMYTYIKYIISLHIDIYKVCLPRIKLKHFLTIKILCLVPLLYRRYTLIIKILF